MSDQQRNNQAKVSGLMRTVMILEEQGDNRVFRPSTVRKLIAERDRERVRAETAEAELSRLRPENAELRAGREWQDISTAPKDGTLVDLFGTFACPGLPGEAALRFTDCRWRDDALHEAGWWTSANWRLNPDGVTHWMRPSAHPARSI